MGTEILADAFASMSTQDQDYFNELLTYPADRLAREPSALLEEQDQLRRQIEETAVANYGSFITTADCLTGVTRDLAAMITSLDALEAQLPSLQANAEEFRKTGTALLARRDALRRLQETQSSLLDILELPTLMDTCIRGGNYDEALDLRSYANKLALVYGDVPVINILTKEVAAGAELMLEQLLSRLSDAIQLPECLRIIGYVRRLGMLQEKQLRVAFLRRREAWILSSIAELESDGRTAYDHLKRLTDVYRVQVFDVAMQYKALFSEGPKILETWADRQIAAYLTSLSRLLPGLTDGGALASVLDHVMYCGASLGRVGMDFRPLVLPLFESAALAMFSSGIAASTRSLTQTLPTHRWVKTAVPVDHKDEATSKLMQHPPLAIYTNGLLAALNELRLCAPASLRDATTKLLQESLHSVASTLRDVSTCRSLTESEDAVIKSAHETFAHSLCPFIAECFDRIYPGSGAVLMNGVVGVDDQLSSDFPLSTSSVVEGQESQAAPV